jgi:hypothetical protein
MTVRGQTELRSPSPVQRTQPNVVDATPSGLSLIGAADWRPVPDFDDPVTQRHPSFDANHPGRMRSSASKTPCDLFLAFFPMELVDPRLIFWREHASEHDRKDLNSPKESMFSCRRMEDGIDWLAAERPLLHGRHGVCALVPDCFSEPAVHH